MIFSTALDLNVIESRRSVRRAAVQTPGCRAEALSLPYAFMVSSLK